MATLNGLDIVDDSILINRYDHTDRTQSQRFTIGGRQVLEHGFKDKGRLLDIDISWLLFSTLEELEILRDGAVFAMPLVLTGGESFSVVWNHLSKKPITATPIGNEKDCYEPTDPFKVLLKLIEV